MATPRQHIRDIESEAAHSNAVREMFAGIARRYDLLNHVPLLVEGIAAFLKRPEREIDSKAPVVAKAMELGALRHAQGFDAYEILKEYEMLAEILFSFLRDTSDSIDGDFTRRDFLICWERLGQGMELIRQATMSHFLRLSSAQINERENRLRKFNQMVAHELKNNINAISNASTALSEEWVAPSDRKELDEVIGRNAASLQRVLTNLEALSRSQADSRHCRNVLLPEAAGEGRRIDDVGEQQRGEHALGLPRPQPVVHPAPLHAHRRRVAFDPGVVPGRDVERVPGGEVCRRAVLELDTDRAGEDVAGVRDLARRRARERAHVVRPAPAGPQLHQGDGGLPDGDDPVGAVGVLPRPVGTLQALARDRHGSRR